VQAEKRKKVRRKRVRGRWEQITVTASAKHKSVLDDGDKSVLDDGKAGMKTGGSARGAKQKVGRKKEAVPRGGTK
jgi:hypothetical protein